MFTNFTKGIRTLICLVCVLTKGATIVTPTSGQEFLLETVAVVVVGGVSLAGGKGGIKDALIGALILASLSNLMNIMLVSQYIQSAVEGVIILIAVMANLRLGQAQ